MDCFINNTEKNKISNTNFYENTDQEGCENRFAIASCWQVESGFLDFMFHDEKFYTRRS